METTASIDDSIGIELLYRNRTIDNISFNDVDIYNKFCHELGMHPLEDVIKYGCEYNIPQKFLDIDVEQYVLYSRSHWKQKEYNRILEELEEFKTRNLFPVLRLMIYLVDFMRKNNIVWGAGRGSSVNSYLLYIIGIHKIDSIRYNLDINEFLK